MKAKSIAFNTLRSSPKYENIVDSCSRYQLSRAEFPFIGEEPKNVSAIKPKAYHGNTGNMFGNDSVNDEELPNLILFSIGGITHNEIAALERLHHDKKLNHHLVKGSTTIMNAAELIQKLEDLPMPQEISDGKIIDLKSIQLVIDE